MQFVKKTTNVFDVEILSKVEQQLVRSVFIVQRHREEDFLVDILNIFMRMSFKNEMKRHFFFFPVTFVVAQGSVSYKTRMQSRSFGMPTAESLHVEFVFGYHGDIDPNVK